jgi:hypothetical protein
MDVEGDKVGSHFRQVGETCGTGDARFRERLIGGWIAENPPGRIAGTAGWVLENGWVGLVGGVNPSAAENPFLAVAWMGAWVSAERFGGSPLRIPVRDFRHLFDALFVWVAIFLCEPEPVGMLAQPDHQRLLTVLLAVSVGSAETAFQASIAAASFGE